MSKEELEALRSRQLEKDGELKDQIEINAKVKYPHNWDKSKVKGTS